MRYQLLGPFDVFDEDGHSLALGGERQRALLVLLVLNANEVVSIDRIIDSLWDEDPPETANNIVQVYVSRLRKALEPDVGRDQKPAVFLTRRPGYSLRVGVGEVDAPEFNRLATEGRAALEAGNPAVAATRLREGLDLWRGEAIADFAYEGFAAAVANRLAEERVTALEDLSEARLALREHAQLVPELEALVDRYPYRERLHFQLMLALYRSGRQGDSLSAYRNAAETLLTELGIDPGPELQQLEHQILSQDPSLVLPGRASADLSALPLIGRSRPVAALAEAVAMVTAGASALVRVIGEPEAGVERLLDEAALLADAAGLNVERVRAFAAEAPGSLMERLSAGTGRPSALIVQSAHHAAPDSLASLAAKLRSDTPTLVVVGQKPQVGRADQALRQLGSGVATIELKVDRVSRSEIGAVTDTALADWLFSQTGGDAYELSRVLELLRDRGSLRSSDGQVSFVGEAFPEDVPLPLTTQVANLPAPDRLIVEACAVAAETIPLRVVARLAGKTPLEVVDRLDHLIANGFLDETDRGVTVSASLSASQLSDRVGAVRRTAVAQALLDAWVDQVELADGAVVGLVAELAGNFEMAADTLIESADRYVALQHLSEAQPLLEAAARCLRAVGEQSSGRWGHVHLQLASCHRLAGWPLLADQALREAVQFTTGLGAVDARGWAAQIASDRQDPASAEWIASVGQLLARQLGAPAKAASLLSLQAHVLNRLGFPTEADDCSARSRLVLDEVGEPHQKFLASYNQAWIEFDRGHARNAEAGFARLIGSVVDDSDERMADLLAWRSRCLFRLGRVDEALSAADQALALASVSGDVGPAFLVHMSRAEGAGAFGFGPDAEASAREMLGVVLHQLPAWENAARFLLAKAHLARGSLQEADDELANALATCPDGVSGRRWRLTCEALGHLIAYERGAPIDHSADQLVEDLLAVQWHEPAIELLIAQASSHQEVEPAARAARLAVELGLASCAGRADAVVRQLGGELDEMVADGAKRLVAVALGTMPATWRETFNRALDGAAAPVDD